MKMRTRTIIATVLLAGVVSAVIFSLAGDVFLRLFGWMGEQLGIGTTGGERLGVYGLLFILVMFIGRTAWVSRRDEKARRELEQQNDFGHAQLSAYLDV